MEDPPHLTWVLVGDDGEHDPDLYGDLARAYPDRVATIARRHVRLTAPTGADQKAGSSNEMPILRGADGDELRPLLHDGLRSVE